MYRWSLFIHQDRWNEINYLIFYDSGSILRNLISLQLDAFIYKTLQKIISSEWKIFFPYRKDKIKKIKLKKMKFIQFNPWVTLKWKSYALYSFQPCCCHLDRLDWSCKIYWFFLIKIFISWDHIQVEIHYHASENI